MTEMVPMQSLYGSMQDENKICSFDIEVVSAPTTPLLHPMARFWWVDSGAGTLALNNRRYPLKGGTLVSVLPWQITDIVAVEEPLRLFVLAYCFDNVNEIVKTVYNPGKGPLSLLRAMEEDPVIGLAGEAAKEARALFLRIRDEIGMAFAPPPREGDAAGALGNLYITNKLVEILVTFLRARGRPEAPPEGRGTDPSGIFLYLYSHLQQKITLAQLSRIFFMSESAISAYITSTTGLSFFDLLHEMRVGRTINYLLYTDFTLEELAEILGFVDSAHISKVFLARIGMGANEFRSTYQKVGNLCRIRDKRAYYALVSYLYRHYSEDLRPREVGERFGMSPRELNRILLYQVEMGFSDFLNFVRVNRASELLLQTDKTVLEIALEVGYHSEKTLSRHFLRFRSTTPGKFRRTVQLQGPG